MGTSPNAHNGAMHDIHNVVYPCVSSDLAAMPHQVSLTDRSWPFLGSFVVHVMLIAILLSPMFQYPITIKSQTPTIFWFSTMSLPSTDNETEQPLLGPSVAFAAQHKESYQQDSPVADNPEPVNTPDTDAETSVVPNAPELSLATPVPVIKAVRSEKVTTQPAILPTKTPAPAAAPAKKVTVPLETEPERQHTIASSLPAIATPVESQSGDNGSLTQSRADQVQQDSVEQKKHAAEQLQREQIIREQEQQSIRDQLEREHIEAEKARRKQLARDNELQKRKELAELIRRQEMERVARTTSMRDLSAISAIKNKPVLQQTPKKLEPTSTVQQVDKPGSVNMPLIKPVPQQIPKNLEPPSPVRQVDKPGSVSLPLIKGDIKLVIAGSKLPDTTITFKDFAQTRRGRPFSLAESRRNTKIIPLAANRDNTREVVIDRANPGVYTVTAESAGEPANVTLSLKLYEGTSRAITRELGKQAIAGKKILVKILMPEGILWDDNSAFSGNMQDSDGVTKFNTETGLMWKEYTD